MRVRHAEARGIVKSDWFRRLLKRLAVLATCFASGQAAALTRPDALRADEVIDRVAEIRRDLLANDGEDRATRRGTDYAQWFNWPNFWANWPNWGNWANWGNWRNW